MSFNRDPKESAGVSSANHRDVARQALTGSARRKERYAAFSRLRHNLRSARSTPTRAPRQSLLNQSTCIASSSPAGSSGSRLNDLLFNRDPKEAAGVGSAKRRDVFRQTLAGSARRKDRCAEFSRLRHVLRSARSTPTRAPRRRLLNQSTNIAASSPAASSHFAVKRFVV